MNILNVGYDSANYYLVEQNGTRLLVDVGWPGTLAKLSANLKRKDVALADVQYLIVTHYHPDHAGLVQELKNKGVKHVVFEQQLPAIPLLKGYVKRVVDYIEIDTRDSLRLSTEQSRTWLNGIGLQGEVVHTPGHSDDSISLVLDSGIAFTGDLLPPDLAGDAAETAGESWTALRALGVKTAYPGHGRVRPIP